jgi:sugar transferase EpsL
MALVQSKSWPWAKRALDIVGATTALFLLSPVLAAVAVAVRMKLGSPIFFRQVRPGLHGQPFALVKFRTMVDARGADGKLLPDQERLPAFGRWLRSTSLDELPELWNVIKGEMSLVGPRPLLMHYLPLYSAEQSRRHEVRPGLTGWAQINGRNAITWDEKLALDVWYVDHHSLTLDARILAATVESVFRRHGIAAADSVSMPEFTGPSDAPMLAPDQDARGAADR